MTIIVFFIFGAVIFGAGAMLSPAYPTAQPRIGLSGALALALIAGGAVFYGTAFGWNTLVVDYMLFLLVTGIFLGGTLSYGQKRAEQRGEELADQDQGWPGPFDLIGLGAALGLFVLIVAVLAAPNEALDFDASQINNGTLSMYVTDTPAYTTLTAYLTGQINTTLPDVQRAVTAVLAGLCVWITYDLGAEIRDKRLGRWLALAMTAAVLWPVYTLQGAALLGLVFTLALAAFSLRYARQGLPVDLACAGLMFGASALSTGPLLWAALIVVVLSAVGIGARTQPMRGAVYGIVVTVIALAATLPTLVNHGWALSQPDTALLGIPVLALTALAAGIALDRTLTR